ncbi:L-gulonolactone oxidase, partial [Stegodyphus mimosarum]
MLSDGSVKKFSADRDKELFLAAVCSLGSFGIILRVSLQCEAAFNLQLRQYSLGLQDVIEHLDVHIEGSDHFRFMWFPYTDGVVVCHSQRTEKPITKVSRLQKCYDWFWNYGIGYYTLEFFYYLSTYHPFLVPYINRIFYNLMYSTPVSKVDRSYKIFNFECLFKQYVNEWAIPKSKTGVVLWTLREWMLSSPDIYVHFPVEVRFVKGDNILISPAYGQDVCYINIIMYRPYGKTVPYKEYWRAYENIMAEANGRPHWAKAHNVKAETFRQIYPYFGKWCLIREMLDPINMFYNAYMARIFSMESQTT